MPAKCPAQALTYVVVLLTAILLVQKAAGLLFCGIGCIMVTLATNYHAFDSWEGASLAK